MNKNIDCLLIGHNEVNFIEYENLIRQMGVDSGSYRDLSRSFIYYDNKPNHIADIFNLFYCNDKSVNPLSLGDSFSATIAYLGSYLDKYGLSFDFVNSFQNEKNELAKKLQEDNILTVAITTTLYFISHPIIEIIKFIRKYNSTAKIIIGGPYVKSQVLNANSQEELHYFFNSIEGPDVYINNSQGEKALVDIINCYKNNGQISEVGNIWYSNGDVFIPTEYYPEDNPLVENMVNWSVFGERVEEYVGLRTSISCLFSCAYCGYPEHAGRYQNAEIAGIERELNQLESIGKVKSVHFIDDTLNVPKDRFKNILRMMIKNKYSFKWNSNLRCQFIDREVVELMMESGCEGVYLGLESGNNEILKNMNKGATVEKYREGIALLKEYGILTMGSFIVGFPGETYDTFQDTVNLINESGLDFYRAHLWYCWPITSIWKQREKYQIEGSNFEWSHSTMNSKTAADLIDEMFLSIDKSIWVPQYNFDFDNIFHMTNRGMSLEQTKNFVRAFNEGLKERLINPSAKEVSTEVLKRLRMACGDSEEKKTEKTVNLDNRYEVTFDF